MGCGKVGHGAVWSGLARSGREIVVRHGTLRRGGVVRGEAGLGA